MQIRPRDRQLLTPRLSGDDVGGRVFMEVNWHQQSRQRYVRCCGRRKDRLDSVISRWRGPAEIDPLLETWPRTAARAGVRCEAEG
ncbi:hypothetical protein J6590_009066 [Homalodisca vitripennis]|nr:hypothetical protein J6590_009066 [Homalodisca vitripennis]